MIDQYKQSYIEEARELVAELESALLELDQNRDDLEIVGRAFRALHTIKGSGAMFGFDDIARFAHNLEAVFDRLRKGDLKAGSDLINLSLAAGDQIKSMLEQASGGAAADMDQAARILAELSGLTGTQEQGAPEPAAQEPAAKELDAPAAAAADGGASGGTARRWRIHFRPGADVILNGTNPLHLLAELRDLGSLEAELDPRAIPPLNQIDPERCYVAWNLMLTTAATLEAIRDIFIFIEGECELRIQPEAGPDDAPEPRDRTREAKPVPGARAAGKGAAITSIRVSSEKLDQLVNLVGELVTVQARLSEAAARSADSDLGEIAESVERLTADLRENSMGIRMLPLRNTFERFRRLVHDLGAELGKDVELAIEGADTELDKTVIDQLNDPLVHLIRNSMDHGIEGRAARLDAGKPPTATIRISAQHSGANVLIRVTDDGRGLDADAVRNRALEHGLIDASARLSEAKLAALILSPGFSTARKVTDVSGRGVGMDVVRRSVEALQGSLEIASKPGLGVTVTLRLPLTLAIIDGLLVRVGDAYFVLPLANSLECIELTRQDIERAHGHHVASVRGQMISYIRLSEFFEIHAPAPEREQIMVVETEHGNYGFVVDQVIGDHQTVIKTLGKAYRNVQVVSGATILGNGTVALILDPHRLVENALRTETRGPAARSRRETSPLRDGEGVLDAAVR